MNLQQAFDAGFEAVKGYVERSFDAYEARLAAVEQRLAAVELRGLEYRGIWQRAVAYCRGAAVTHDGSLFIALADTEGAEPGSSASAWQLAVKRGRDADQRARA
jgi:hypothetical protein